MKMDRSISVFGHICLDITPKILADHSDSLKPGSLYPCRGVNVSLGGATANTGLALKALGNNNVKIVARIGDDQFGSTVSEMLNDSGVDCHLSIDPIEATSYSVIIAKSGIDRIFFHDPGANSTFDTGCIPFETLNADQLIHFGYPPMMKTMIADLGKELKKMFLTLKNIGCTTSLDMCMPDTHSSQTNSWRELLSSVLQYVDIYIPSAEEALFMTNRTRYEEIKNQYGFSDFVEGVSLADLHQLGEQLLSYGVAVVAIKCGKRGYYVRSAEGQRIQKMGAFKPANTSNWQNRELFMTAVLVERVVSATGAGDASIAGFLQALGEGETIEDALAIACTAGAIATQSFDAVSALKSYNVLQQIAGTQTHIPISDLDKFWQQNGPLMIGPEDISRKNICR